MADIRINALATTATTPASDDYLALDGTAQGTRKILATNIANNVTDVILGSSGPSVKSTLSARAPRQGLVFDGSANATVTVAAFGATDFSVFTWVNVTSFASARSIIGGSTGAFVFSVNTSGALVVGKYGSADLAVSTSTLTAGKNTLVGYVRSGTTGTYYINGISAGTTSDSYNYTAADSQIGANGGGSSIFLGVIDPIYPYNRAISASEVVALYEAGAPAGADYNSASNTAINTSAFTNDGTFGLNYSTFSGASATGFTAAQATATAGMAEMKPNLSAKVGKRYRVSFTATLTSGQAPTFQTQDGSGNQCFPQVTVTNGANSFEVTMNSFASGTLVTSFYTSNVTSYAISSFSMVPLGLLLAPDAAQAGGGLVWYDTSGNGANITLPASGVTWNVPTSGNVTSGGNVTLVPATGYKTYTAKTIQSQIGTGATGAANVEANSALITQAAGGTLGLYFSHDTNANRPLIQSITGGMAFSMLLNPYGGNLLIGTTTDGGQKLQVAGNVQITNTGANGLVVTNTQGNALAVFNNSAADASGVNNGYFTIQTASTPRWYFGQSVSALNGDFQIYSVALGASALTLAKATGNATFAGSIAIGNTVQTAAAVASTHKVTISIGGTTYYLLATNV